jgi:hypothetical protein
MKPCGNPLTNAIGGRVRCSATGAAAALALLATIAGGVQAGDDWAGLRAPGVARSGGIRLEPPRLMAAARDTSLTCFEGPLSLIINPGCFDTAPGTPCQSRSTALPETDIRDMLLAIGLGVSNFWYLYGQQLQLRVKTTH